MSEAGFTCILSKSLMNTRTKRVEITSTLFFYFDLSNCAESTIFAFSKILGKLKTNKNQLALQSLLHHFIHSAKTAPLS